MGSVKILRASAGSGKTYRLAYEYISSVIRDPFLYKQILAVTFTNKATEEMKLRIISEINALACGIYSPYLNDLISDTGLGEQAIRKCALTARTRILHDYSHFSILTIDKFFQRIIRAFIKELGIDMNFNLELQTETLLGNAADNLIDEITVNETLKQWIIGFIDEKIAENKVWDVKRELTELGKEVFREGYKNTDGTSKERLARIVSTVGIQAENIRRSMTSDARKALDIMRANNITVSDFSNGNTGFANYFARIGEGDFAPYSKRVQEALASDEKWYSKTSPLKEVIISLVPRLRPLLENICGTYDTNARFLNSAILLKENYRNFALLTDLAAKIRELCALNNVMPISETNAILNKLVSNNDTPFIFEKAGNHFSRFMIDEFQDTSAKQWENFIPLLRNAVSQSEDAPVLIVGDIKQSIYRWRGGDWKILAREIKKEFGEVIEQELSVNYRSMRNIVEFNNDIVDACVKEDNRILNEMLEQGHRSCDISAEFRNTYTDMLSAAYANHRQTSRSDKAEGYINITRYAGDETSGDPPVIKHIEQLQARGYAACDIAILVRYKKEGVHIANMLLDHKSRHPHSPYIYDVVTQEALTIGFAPVIRYIVAVMKLAVTKEDPVSTAIYNMRHGNKVDREMPREESLFISSLEMLTPLDAFERIVMRYALNDKGNDIAYLQAFQEQIITFGTSTVSDIPLFIKWWEESGAGESIDMPRNSNSITIITVHKSKGLQYKAVIIPYCDWSMAPKSNSVLWAGSAALPFGELDKIPIGYKKDAGRSFFAEDYYREMVMSHIDNINTFYVAATRAEEELHVMMPFTAKPSPGRISGLILSGMDTNGGDISLGALKGSATAVGNGDRVMEFGTPVDACRKKTEEQTISTRFHSRNNDMKIKLRLRSQRYFEDGEAGAARNYGVLMHKVFEMSNTLSDIERSITQMSFDGVISVAEASALKDAISASLDNSVTRSWFSERWQVVRNENDIIIPGSRHTKRPDRVMTDGPKAVIVDYKFGLGRESSHKKQIREYGSLLLSMGYKEVDGYIWYVSLNDIEPVAIGLGV